MYIYEDKVVPTNKTYEVARLNIIAGGSCLQVPAGDYNPDYPVEPDVQVYRDGCDVVAHIAGQTNSEGAHLTINGKVGESVGGLVNPYDNDIPTCIRMWEEVRKTDTTTDPVPMLHITFVDLNHDVQEKSGHVVIYEKTQNDSTYSASTTYLACLQIGNGSTQEIFSGEATEGAGTVTKANVVVVKTDEPTEDEAKEAEADNVEEYFVEAKEAEAEEEKVEEKVEDPEEEKVEEKVEDNTEEENVEEKVDPEPTANEEEE